MGTQATGRWMLAAAGLCCAGALSAAATDAVPMRQQHMKQLGAANKAVGDALRASPPAMPAIQANAALLAAAAAQIAGWFPQGSGPDADPRSKALPAVWTQNAQFRAAVADFTAKTRALNDAAKAGDVARVTTAAGAVGASCKACHENFKARQ